MLFTSHGTEAALATSLFTNNPAIIATAFVVATLPDVLPYFDGKNRANTINSLKQLKMPKMDYTGWYNLFHKTKSKLLRILFTIIFLGHTEVDKPMHRPDTGKYYLWAKALAVAHLPLDAYLIVRFLF